jgi:hypothetical protein
LRTVDVVEAQNRQKGSVRIALRAGTAAKRVNRSVITQDGA